MNIKLYQVDAFTDSLFSGNPAAVCPLDEWLNDDVMQKIAMENNLAETAFVVKTGNQYQIRWFTPAVEVDLCGHATLAAAFVLFNCEGLKSDVINFYSPRSGVLTVKNENNYLTLNFPVDKFEIIEAFDGLTDGFNVRPFEILKGKTDYVLVFENEDQVQSMEPDLSVIAKVKARGVIITAPGTNVDFVSRFFAPQSGIPEDPVTGSAHTTLTPYWSHRLGKDELTARQLSLRSGFLKCRNIGERVEISGQARLYLSGEIFI